MGKVRLCGVLLTSLLAALWLVDVPSATLAGAGAAYTAPLVGGEEVPPRTTPASGQATFQVSADGLSMTYSVTVSNITNVLYGHIHLAPKGQNGDVVVQLVPDAPPGGGPKSGVIGQGTVTAAQLTGPLQGKTLADLVAQMDAGNTYVNIHTGSGASPATLQPGDIPPGEIRGQIVVAPTGPAASPTVAPTGPAASPAARAIGPAASPTVAPTAAVAVPTTAPRTGGGFGAGGEAPRAWIALAVALVLAASAIGACRWQA